MAGDVLRVFDLDAEILAEHRGHAVEIFDRDGDVLDAFDFHDRSFFYAFIGASTKTFTPRAASTISRHVSSSTGTPSRCRSARRCRSGSPGISTGSSRLIGFEAGALGGLAPYRLPNQHLVLRHPR